MSSNPSGLSTIQPQTLFRFSKPEARPYIVVGPDPEHADFGPFTPGTKTWGLQEATNYAVANNISEIRCIGHFVFPNLNLNVGYSIQQIPEPVAIMLPLVDANTSPLIILRYVGMGAQASTYETNTATGMGATTNSETIFEITDTNDYRNYAGTGNLVTNGSLFGTGNPSSFLYGHTNIQVEFENITFLSPNNGLPHTPVDGFWFAGLRMRNVSVDVKRTTPTAVTQPQTNAGVGAIFPTTLNMGVSEADSLNVTGYYRGIVYGTHFTAGIIHIYNCYIGLQPLFGYHPAQIFYANIEQCVYNIDAADNTLFVPSSRGIPQVTTNIYMLDIQKTASSAGTWNVNQADIYANPPVPNQPFTLNVDYLSQIVAGVGRQPPTLTVYYPNPSNISLNINVKGPADPTLPFSQTIPANPPASGVTYQNVNPYGIVLLIPVSLTPTSSASASASIAVGTSPSTLSTVQTLTQAAGASPTGGVLQAAVPSGQYYQITLTNATAYQAIVLPE